MMKFIYDSLETVKKIQHPSKKDFINLTLAIFGLVFVSGVFFIISDTIFSNIYKWFYGIMK